MEIENKIEFKIKNLLSGEDLILSRERESLFEFLTFGLKETSSANINCERKQQINERLDNLKSLISFERVERSIKRSHGQWEPDTQSIRMLRKEGKWNNFGYSDNQIDYLTPYEGLYLMELNRLELYYNGSIVSIEQGYRILLSNNQNSISIGEYLVYARLMRYGYILLEYDGNDDYIDRATYQNCVFFNLCQQLPNQNCTILECDLPQFLVKDLKLSMQSICDRTKSASFSDTLNDPSTSATQVDRWCVDRKSKTFRKRKNQRPPDRRRNVSKRVKTIFPTDVLRNDTEARKYRHIFNDLNFIQSTNEQSEIDTERKPGEFDLKISFNMYLPNRNFKKSEPSKPDYQIVVVPSDEQVPAHEDLLEIYDSTNKIPIIVVFMTENGNFNGFLYQF